MEERLSPLVVCIDPGHTYVDGEDIVPGKQSPGKDPIMREQDWTWEMAHLLSDALEEDGHTCVITVPDGQKVKFGLRDRVIVANKAKADLFLSIHANAQGNGKWVENARGYVVFANESGKLFGQCIVDEFRKGETPLLERRGGMMGDEGYGVLVMQNHRPACLVEPGFMTCHDDVLYLVSEEGKTVLTQIFRRSVNRMSSLLIKK